MSNFHPLPLIDLAALAGPPPASETTDEVLGSVLEHRTLDDIYQEIQSVYLADSRPWTIGFSGGKDSSAVLQLVWYALAALPRDRLTKPVYVIASDTLVETPLIV